MDRDQNERFPDLAELPPELGLAVLSHLNATDLCLAGCVWNDLAHDEILWMGYVICIHIAKYVVCSMKIQHLKNLSRLDIFDSKLQSNEEQYQNVTHIFSNKTYFLDFRLPSNCYGHMLYFNDTYTTLFGFISMVSSINRLCKSQWGYSSIYHSPGKPLKSYRKIYLLLDEGSLTFCADADMVIPNFLLNFSKFLIIIDI